MSIKEDEIYWNVQILQIPDWIRHISKEIVQSYNKKTLKVEIEAICMHWSKRFKHDLFILASGELLKVRVIFQTEDKPLNFKLIEVETTENESLGGYSCPKCHSNDTVTYGDRFQCKKCGVVFT